MGIKVKSLEIKKRVNFLRDAEVLDEVTNFLNFFSAFKHWSLDSRELDKIQITRYLVPEATKSHNGTGNSRYTWQNHKILTGISTAFSILKLVFFPFWQSQKICNVPAIRGLPPNLMIPKFVRRNLNKKRRSLFRVIISVTQKKKKKCYILEFRYNKDSRCDIHVRINNLPVFRHRWVFFYHFNFFPIK